MLGIVAQWLAWRVKLPSILLLLVTGIVAGPVTGWLHPDKLFGDLMLPLVSLSVAVILYEGGLNLKIRELRAVGGVFFLLTTVGVAISWVIGTLAARYILGFEWSVSTLLGAILVVTGPTVIGPILRHLRLRGKVSALLKWEGIIIDPIGATLAVLVFTVVQAGGISEGFQQAINNLAMATLVGILAGGIAAGLLVLVLARFWVPDTLYNPVSLMLMFGAFTIANVLQEESGLLAVTVMGIVLANQKRVSVRHVVEFKETLTVLLISCLFITLSARLTMKEIEGLGWDSFSFVLVMLVVARPVSVLASTLGSSLTWKERCFLCCMAPRGIVAAAITSVFALSLIEAGYPTAEAMVPVTFLMVFVTVLLYGLGGGPLARYLGLTQDNPQGFLFVGAGPWVRALAQMLQKEGFTVFLIDTDMQNITQSQAEGIPSLNGSALADDVHEEIDYSGLGRMMAVTPNKAVNSLACLRYAEDFGRGHVYQLPFAVEKAGLHEAVPLEHRGRLLFGKALTKEQIKDIVQGKYHIKKDVLTKEFNYKNYTAKLAEHQLPLMVVKTDRTIEVYTAKYEPSPQPGDFIISLVQNIEEPIISTPDITPAPAST